MKSLLWNTLVLDTHFQISSSADTSAICLSSFIVCLSKSINMLFIIADSLSVRHALYPSQICFYLLHKIKLLLLQPLMAVSQSQNQYFCCIFFDQLLCLSSLVIYLSVTSPQNQIQLFSYWLPDVYSRLICFSLDQESLKEITKIVSSFPSPLLLLTVFPLLVFSDPYPASLLKLSCRSLCLGSAQILVSAREMCLRSLLSKLN